MGAELGKYKACVSARSTDKEILKGAQDGGIVTSLFAYALEEGIIDGAIVAGTYDDGDDNDMCGTASRTTGDQNQSLQLQRQNCSRHAAPR